MHTLTVVVELSSATHGEPLMDALAAVLDVARGAVNHAVLLEERDELSPRKLAPLRDFVAAVQPGIGVGDVVREHLPKLAGMLADDAMAAWNEPPESVGPTEMTAGPGQYIIRGSSGNILIHSGSGKVLKLEGGPEAVTAYGNIERFDLDEYRAWDARNMPKLADMQETDILLIGHWYRDGDGHLIYSPAAPEDREDAIASA